ncbi:FAD-dependent monooxygenase [Nonomuraea lactucae]|uniref:FAD-dependent monooxygenase n=1 Tax=Nonomuraea lactucae TaxID=2249762 RepID=UPI000DE1FEC4|nr:FAD-dependent monooxygenase [Nonomuraea lactucae]
MNDSRRVLVAGGGLSGLATAAFLATTAPPCLLVERRTEAPRTSRNERLSVRAVELLDSLGLREAVSEAGFHPAELGDMLRVDTATPRTGSRWWATRPARCRPRRVGEEPPADFLHPLVSAGTA